MIDEQSPGNNTLPSSLPPEGGIVEDALMSALEENLTPEQQAQIAPAIEQALQRALGEEQAELIEPPEDISTLGGQEADIMAAIDDFGSSPSETLSPSRAPHPTMPGHQTPDRTPTPSPLLERGPQHPGDVSTSKRLQPEGKSPGGETPPSTLGPSPLLGGGPSHPEDYSVSKRLQKDKPTAPLPTPPLASPTPGAQKKDVAGADGEQPSPDTSVAATQLQRQKTQDRQRVKQRRETDAKGAERISNQIRGLHFRLYPIALLLAGAKDFVDAILELETAGFGATLLTIASFLFVGLPLWMMIRLQISGQGEEVGRRVVQRFVQMFALELVPGLNIIPTQVIFVIWLKRHTDKKRKEKEQEAQKLQQSRQLAQVEGQIQAT